jgi:4-hydroxybenzoate polyprenyltransferase
VKQHRPLAAGTIRPGEALTLSGVLLAAGLACAWWASPTVLLMVFIYLAVNVGYSLGLKHVVIVDVFLIGTGFMLRLLAGTSGVDIPPSQWLLLCGLMVALFLGFAKRRAELGTAVAAPAAGHRKVLEHYTPRMLDSFIAITATSMVLTYSLYTMSPDTIHIHGTANLIYTVPFVLFGVFRYLFLLYRQERGGDPSRDLVRDPFIMVCVIAWLATTLWLIR